MTFDSIYAIKIYVIRYRSYGDLWHTFWFFLQSRKKWRKNRPTRWILERLVQKSTMSPFFLFMQQKAKMVNIERDSRGHIIVCFFFFFFRTSRITNRNIRWLENKKEWRVGREKKSIIKRTRKPEMDQNLGDRTITESADKQTESMRINESVWQWGLKSFAYVICKCMFVWACVSENVLLSRWFQMCTAQNNNALMGNSIFAALTKKVNNTRMMPVLSLLTIVIVAMPTLWWTGRSKSKNDRKWNMEKGNKKQKWERHKHKANQIYVYSLLQRSHLISYNDYAFRLKQWQYKRIRTDAKRAKGMSQVCVCVS